MNLLVWNAVQNSHKLLPSLADTSSTRQASSKDPTSEELCKLSGVWPLVCSVVG